MTCKEKLKSTKGGMHGITIILFLIAALLVAYLSVTELNILGFGNTQSITSEQAPGDAGGGITDFYIETPSYTPSQNPVSAAEEAVTTYNQRLFEGLEMQQ